MMFYNENDVRKYLKSEISDIKDSNEMSHYDMQTPRNIIEIKVRNKYYNNWMIEKYKYDKLLELCNDKGCYYLIAFKSVLFWYNLKNINISELKEVEMNCPKSTQFKNNNIIKKPSYLLPNNKKIKYDTNI